MDEQFVRELVDDLEHMGRLIERCVKRLRLHMSGNPDSMAPKAAIANAGNDIRSEIERHRREIMAQVDQAKAQALQAAAAAKTSAPAMGAMPGMLPGGAPMSSDLMAELRHKLAEGEKR